MSEMGIGIAILGVMSEVGYVQKERAAGLNYSFASEAALIEALRPAMVRNGIFASVVDLTEITQDGFVTKNGTAMNRTFVHGIVRFTHPASDTHIDVHAMGEGMDPGDKSANKAATSLLKYALRQTFLIETGDDPDKDASGGQERITPTNRTSTLTEQQIPVRPAPVAPPAPVKKPPAQKPPLSAEKVREFIWEIVEKSDGAGEEFSEELRAQIVQIVGGQLSALEADPLQAGLDVFEYLSGNRDPASANHLMWQAIWRWLALETKDGMLTIGRLQAVEEIGNCYSAYATRPA